MFCALNIKVGELYGLESNQNYPLYLNISSINLTEYDPDEQYMIYILNKEEKFLVCCLNKTNPLCSNLKFPLLSEMKLSLESPKQGSVSLVGYLSRNSEYDQECTAKFSLLEQKEVITLSTPPKKDIEEKNSSKEKKDTPSLNKKRERDSSKHGTDSKNKTSQKVLNKKLPVPSLNKLPLNKINLNTKPQLKKETNTAPPKKNIISSQKH